MSNGEPAGQIAHRTRGGVTGGTQHRIVRMVLDPRATGRPLATLGRTSEIAVRGDRLVGTARPH